MGKIKILLYGVVDYFNPIVSIENVRLPVNSNKEVTSFNLIYYFFETLIAYLVGFAAFKALQFFLGLIGLEVKVSYLAVPILIMLELGLSKEFVFTKLKDIFQICIRVLAKFSILYLLDFLFL